MTHDLVEEVLRVGFLLGYGDEVAVEALKLCAIRGGLDFRPGCLAQLFALRIELNGSKQHEM